MNYGVFALAKIAQGHAKQFIGELASNHMLDIQEGIGRLCNAHSILADYADTFIETLRRHDQCQGTSALSRFQEYLEKSVSSQGYERAKRFSDLFDAQDMEGMARQDADAYVALTDKQDVANLPLLWERIAMWMGHQTYRHALIAQLVLRGIPAQRFTRDLSAHRSSGNPAEAFPTTSPERDGPLQCLALRHSNLYLDPSLCEQQGYDQSRLLGEIFALKQDMLYWQNLEAHLLASDPIHGALHLYWFRQEIAFFEANRKSPLFNADDLFAFGMLNPALLTEPDAHVLQGGMAGALRTAHGHSERGAYAHQELKKGSFADAIKDL